MDFFGLEIDNIIRVSGTRHPEHSEGSPECGIVLNRGDPSLRSGASAWWLDGVDLREKERWYFRCSSGVHVDASKDTLGFLMQVKHAHRISNLAS